MQKNISPFEQAVIDRVREMRIKRGISQEKLAALIEATPTYIGDVESPKRMAKYNLNHINRLALVFGCNICDLLPEKPIAEKE